MSYIYIDYPPTAFYKGFSTCLYLLLEDNEISYCDPLQYRFRFFFMKFHIFKFFTYVLRLNANFKIWFGEIHNLSYIKSRKIKNIFLCVLNISLSSLTFQPLFFRSCDFTKNRQISTFGLQFPTFPCTAKLKEIFLCVE